MIMNKPRTSKSPKMAPSTAPIMTDLLEAEFELSEVAEEGESEPEFGLDEDEGDEGEISVGLLRG